MTCSGPGRACSGMGVHRGQPDAEALQMAARKREHCPECGAFLSNDGGCTRCDYFEPSKTWTAKRREARRKAVQSARQIMSRDPCFIDTETTGFRSGDEIVEVSVVDADGKVLFNSLVRPTCEVPEDATAIHGIGPEDLQDAPTFAEVFDDLSAVMHGRPVVAYNADFDMRLLYQSAKACGRAGGLERQQFLARWSVENGGMTTHCAMKLYARYQAQPKKWGGWRWHKLGVAARQQGIDVEGLRLHRAHADTEVTRQLMCVMAKGGEE